MIEIRQHAMPPLEKGKLAEHFNVTRPALERGSVMEMNRGKSYAVSEVRQEYSPREIPMPTAVNTQQKLTPIREMKIPQPTNPVRRGQKTALDLQRRNITRVRIGFGWNVSDSRCDVDASAFAITQTGKVLNENWFIFYSQPQSPDGSIRFYENSQPDREAITVDVTAIDPAIQKIVIVLTINEALENRLNFGMIRDAYLRILDDRTGTELLYYRVEEYFENVTSMTLGELYLHNGSWKFNPIGNGVRMDLAGQCGVYGVEIE